MKNFSAWLLGGLLCTQLPAAAQPLVAGTGQLAFGNVTELTPDSLQLTLTNPYNFAIPVTGISFFNTYRAPAFSVQQPVFLVPANGSQTVWVKFTPQHNIAHNTELVIHTGAHLGSIAVDLVGQGVYTNTYYSTSQNKEEELLKTALKTKISAGYNSLGYNTARDRMFMQIDNKKVNGQGAAQNTLECVYTGRQAVGYTSRSDAQSGDNFNTEHTFPQGHFNSAEPMKSDLHHLFPTDEAANGSRSNYPFGVASQPYQAVAVNAPSLLGANLRYEPRDAHKGDVARAMMYFTVRYQDYQNFMNAQQATLKIWNYQFQPDAAEKKRNNDIATSANQNNRNPFVDYPQLADRISNFSQTSVAPVVHQLFVSDSVINFGQPQMPEMVYRLVLVNNGNQPISLGNYQLAPHPALSLVSVPLLTPLQPGEARSIDLKLSNLAAADSVISQLTLETTLPNQPMLTVPVFANATVLNGIPAELLPANLSVFPNPASGHLTVSADKVFAADATLSVLNVVGQEVQRQAFTGGENRVNVSGLQAGVYLLQVKSRNGMATQRFVKTAQ